jgi:hypothetical protein
MQSASAPVSELLLMVRQRQARRRRQAKRRQRQRLTLLVLKAVTAATKAHGAELPPALKEALQLLIRLHPIKSLRIPQKLLPRSTDPELLKYLEWPDDYFAKKFRLSRRLFDQVPSLGRSGQAVRQGATLRSRRAGRVAVCAPSMLLCDSKTEHWP